MKKYLTYQNNTVDKFWMVEVCESSYKITWGKSGTIGKNSTKSFHSERECLKEIERLIRHQQKKGYVESSQGFVEKKALPPDLKEALTRRRVLKSRNGKITIFPLPEVRLIAVLVDYQGRTDNAYILPGNPYTVDGLFCTAAYAIGKKSFHTAGRETILVWLPDLTLYGCWSPHQNQLRVFPGSTWNAIGKHLSKYLNPRNHSFPNVLECIKIWEHFSFIPSDLLNRVEKILSFSDRTRQRKVDKFLSEYEHILQKLPFTNALENAFKALVTLYYAKGQWLEADSRYAKAIEWFELSLPIINQSFDFRTKLFRDVFLQLSFCYLETAKFDKALQYINIYQVYDESSRQACDQIKASIHRTQQLYKETINRYLSHIEQNSENGHEAIRVVKNVIKSTPYDPVLHFNLACFYSESGRIKEALYHLEEAFKNGFRNDNRIHSDRELENIRQTREFEEMRLKYLLYE